MMILLGFLAATVVVAERELLVITVATDTTDGYFRWEASVKHYGLDSKTIGMGQKWKGGDLANGPGGAHKINLLKDALVEYKDRSDLLLLFTDAYDVVISGDEKELFQRFDEMAKDATENGEMRVLISAEDLIWPDRSLEPKYPMTLHKRFLCSGGIMAYADTFYELINYKEVENGDDDQLFYTKAYLDEGLRKKYGIYLDSRAELFMNLNGAIEEVSIHFASSKSGENRLRNTKYNTFPLVIHGNGPSKMHLNRLTNYIPLGWRPDYGCADCIAQKIRFETYPKLTLAIFVETATPFLHNMLKRILVQSYAHKDITVFIHSSLASSDEKFAKWIPQVSEFYEKIKYIKSTDGISEPMARKMALQFAVQQKSEYIFMVDGYVQLTNEMTIKRLLEANKDLIAPGLSRYGKLWSNYWGAIGSDGYYGRSDDYTDLVERKRVGIFNVPLITGAMMMSIELAEDILTSYPSQGSSPWKHNYFDCDMAFPTNMRKAGIFMFVTNEELWGRLVDIDHVPLGKKHPELWQAEHNRADWEEDYLDSDYWKKMRSPEPLDEPCPDVVAFPFLSEQGGYDMIEEMEHNGEWSGGNDAHTDKRLNGGYENVPTVDIHMTQIGLQEAWLFVVKTYAAPMITKFYTGYNPDNKPNLMFVVRYKPGEQDRLRPHHDSSTWTFQIALNKPNIDFEGGGTYFTRYKCSVVGNVGSEGESQKSEVKQGMGFAFPGRLTHQHSGLPTTKGTRYILVNFMDS